MLGESAVVPPKPQPKPGDPLIGPEVAVIPPKTELNQDNKEYDESRNGDSATRGRLEVPTEAPKRSESPIRRANKRKTV